MQEQMNNTVGQTLAVRRHYLNAVSHYMRFYRCRAKRFFPVARQKDLTLGLLFI
jgi:hypothetical protein